MIREKVLFINSINTSVPSGGKRITNQVFSEISAFYEIETVNLYPDIYDSTLKKVVIFFPGILFRLFRLEICEYFSKLSIFYVLKFWKLRNTRYKFVIFNHHQTFLYSWLFKCKKYFIIHDLISLKNLKQNSISKIFSERLEAALFFGQDLIFLSKDEHDFVSTTYQSSKNHLLNFFNHPEHFHLWDNKNIILIGNFKRMENYLSVVNFLNLLNDQCISNVENCKFVISVVGYNSSSLKKHLRLNDLEYTLRFLNSYASLNDFIGSLHVAPLLFGAGVKIKVIEAYEAGIPTLGTNLAYQGIEFDTVSRMGIQVNDVTNLTELLLSKNINELLSNRNNCINKSIRLNINDILNLNL